MYIVSSDNIRILNGYQYSKWSFGDVLSAIREAHPDCPKYPRPDICLKLEWATHNAAYRLHYKRERTRDVDLNVQQKWYATLGYCIVGIIALILIP